MSQNISMPAARVPLVDERGQITREWMQWFLGMFQRVGGPVGFSNAELYGDAVALQSYDELLERIGAAEVQRRGLGSGDAQLQELSQRLAVLEAQNRALANGVQMMAMGLVPTVEASSTVSGNVLDELTVKGNTRLATERGGVSIGDRNYNGTKKLHVKGDGQITQGLDVATDSGKLRVGSATYAGSAKAHIEGAFNLAAGHHYTINDIKVVGARVSGVTAYTSYAGQSMAAEYSQTQAQATDDTLKTASAKLAQVVTALRTHGLIGD